MANDIAFKKAYLNDKFVNIEDAKISIMTNALQYGTGIFGGIRGYYNQKENFLSIFRIQDHYKRFISSLNILGVSIKYTQKELEYLTILMAKKNEPKTDVYFRPIAYAGSLGLSPNLAKDSNFDFAMYMIPLGEYIPVDKGISVIVSSFCRINDNAIPSRAKITGGYINSALAKKEAINKSCDEAIFLTQNGHVSEGSAMNIFLVRNVTLITPGKSEDILEGITRKTVIEIASDLGIPVEERTVDRSELYISDELFFCGTGAQISWISEVDSRRIGNGKKGAITTKLQDLFFKIVKGEEKKYKEWCTKIKY